MISNNQDLYSYNQDIPDIQQQSQQQSMNIEQPNSYQQSSISFNKSLNELQNEMNNLNMLKQSVNVDYSINDKIIEFFKYYFITFIIPLIVFVFVFVIFSIDFVKDSIFKILNIENTDGDNISLAICILYGLIIGIVYMIGIKIIEKLVQ